MSQEKQIKRKGRLYHDRDYSGTVRGKKEKCLNTSVLFTKKNRANAVPLEELRTRYRNSYEKLLNNLSSELMFYSCMSIRLGTYIDETTEDGLDMIRAPINM